MKYPVRGLVFAALAAFASANAQTPAPSQVDAARALLEAQGVADLFEAVEADHIKVRHAASGLTCHFFDGEARITIMTFEGLPRGDDVGCASQQADQSITLYATRYSPSISTQEALADAEAAILDRFGDARSTPALLSVSSEGLPQPSARHFLITINDEQWITSAYVAAHEDWIIKLRVTQRASNDQLMASQLEGGAIFTLALMDLEN